MRAFVQTCNDCPNTVDLIEFQDMTSSAENSQAYCSNQIFHLLWCIPHGALHLSALLILCDEFLI